MKTNIDREIIKFIQGDIPVESHPFASLADRLNLSEEEIVEHIKDLQDEGVIRRFAAILRHYNAGFNVNAMVAWKVAVEDADRVGKIMAGFDEVSHCYLRDVPEEFGYNLFSMIHARSDEQIIALLRQLASRTGLSNYIIIKSVRELRKVSMEYV
ncbi:MAG: Lrp/AsnC family transcriptional regulator [Syntrophomonadaceae bacterium]|nr:Lrp/AsnC family transcriptional regulator [Syntrophomonadaceae bacterium]MDD3270705.1 Lrp/AsnC family transcriptional regulator [Syntrophomonadaceae bacterium]MDD3897546.1 Lrp/AsnC family transcriptional regulator [Syntrophomonadaceae bacterium]MDD4561479.1 Lrp/AsnC family transcriptional regulator [Syntrophomonadaceae bacterium]